MAPTTRIAVIGGDGIGPEATAEAARIEQAVAGDLLARQGRWAARSAAEVGDDIAERVSG